MQFCLNRGTAGGDMPLDQFVSLASATGFNGADVDLSYGLEKGASALRDLYANKKLSFGGWGLPVDFRADPSKFHDGLTTLRRLAPIAAELSIDSCATYILPSSDLPLWENWQFHVQRLTPVAKILADHGLRLGLEFISPYHLRRSRPHEFIFTPGQMLELAHAIAPTVGLLVDSFHCHCASIPWNEIAKLPAKKIVLAHLNDAPDVSLTDQQDGNRLLPGEGIINLTAFLSALKTSGYTGPVSVEVFSKELTEMPPEESAQKAAAATKKTAATAGFL